jgi:hypothetical protein
MSKVLQNIEHRPGFAWLRRGKTSNAEHSMNCGCALVSMLDVSSYSIGGLA